MYKAIIFDFFGVIHNGQSVNKDVVKLIASLKGRYKVGLLSNSSDRYLRPMLEEYGLIGLFDEIAISAEVGVIKPDSAIFEHMLKQMDVTAKEAVFTDDNPGNVAAAESVGIRSILFTSEKALRQELAAAGVKVS